MLKATEVAATNKTALRLYQSKSKIHLLNFENQLSLRACGKQSPIFEEALTPGAHLPRVQVPGSTGVAP